MAAERLKTLLNQANGRLKRDGYRVAIAKRGQFLVLRATFPPQDGESEPKQRRLPTKLRASSGNVAASEKMARKIGRDLIDGTFDWRDWGKGPASHQTIAEWIAAFELSYWERRERSAKAQTTWDTDCKIPFSRLPTRAALTVELLREIAVHQSKPETRSRQRFCAAYSRLARFAGLDPGPIQEVKGNYGQMRVKPQDIPSTDLVLEWATKIPNREWQGVYHRLAAYRLRPSEVLLSEFPASGVEMHLPDGKTGARMVLPFPKEWAEMWKPWDVELPRCSGRNNSALGSRVNDAFRRYGVPFPPKALRHHGAIAAIGKLPIAVSAALMGHSVQVHTQVYWHWIKKEDLVTQWSDSTA